MLNITNALPNDEVRGSQGSHCLRENMIDCNLHQPAINAIALAVLWTDWLCYDFYYMQHFLYFLPLPQGHGSFLNGVTKWGQTLIIDLSRLYFCLISDCLDISDLTMFALRLTAELAEFCKVKIYYFCCTLQKFSRISVLNDPIELGMLYIRFL